MVIYISSNISLWATTYDECIHEWMSPDICEADFPDENSTENENTDENTTENTTTESTSNENTSVMGITCNEELLLNGQCKIDINDTLWIRKWERNDIGILVQDVILSATFFIGTVITIALVVSWLMYIFAASSGKDPWNAKKGIIGSILGLIIVASSYMIIRLVQYIAKGF